MDDTNTYQLGIDLAIDRYEAMAKYNEAMKQLCEAGEIPDSFRDAELEKFLDYKTTSFFHIGFPEDTMTQTYRVNKIVVDLGGGEGYGAEIMADFDFETLEISNSRLKSFSIDGGLLDIDSYMHSGTESGILSSIMDYYLNEMLCNILLEQKENEASRA